MGSHRSSKREVERIVLGVFMARSERGRNRTGRPGRGSLKAARRSDSARCERTVTADSGAEQTTTMTLTNGATTTRRRARLQHSQSVSQ